MKTGIVRPRKCPSIYDWLRTCCCGVNVTQDVQTLPTEFKLHCPALQNQSTAARACKVGLIRDLICMLDWIMFASLFLYLYPQLFMESSQNFYLLPFSVHFFCWSDKFYHKQEVRFLLYLLGQIATEILTLIYWIKTWPFTVFNYHS